MQRIVLVSLVVAVGFAWTAQSDGETAAPGDRNPAVEGVIGEDGCVVKESQNDTALCDDTQYLQLSLANGEILFGTMTVNHLPQPDGVILITVKGEIYGLDARQMLFAGTATKQNSQIQDITLFVSDADVDGLSVLIKLHKTADTKVTNIQYVTSEEMIRNVRFEIGKSGDATIMADAIVSSGADGGFEIDVDTGESTTRESSWCDEFRRITCDNVCRNQTEYPHSTCMNGGGIFRHTPGCLELSEPVFYVNCLISDLLFGTDFL